jgi:ArsR family transcriptional regulator
MADIIQLLQPSMMNDETIGALVDYYKLFADNSRLKILYAISMSEICVNDLSKLLNMNQSAISHQLKTLRDANLVKFRREGKMIYYSIDDEHVGQTLLQGILHLSDRG